MTNQYIVEAMNGFDLGLSAEVMAHNDEEAKQLAMREINGNHDLFLNLSDMQVVHVDRGYDGQHDVKLFDSGDYWQELWIDDETVAAEHSISLSDFMGYIMTVCEGQFTFIQEEFPKEDEDGTTETTS